MEINDRLIAAAFERVTEHPEEGDLELTPEQEGKIDEQTDRLINWLRENIDFAEEVGAQYTEDEKQGEILRIGFVLTFMMGLYYGQATSSGQQFPDLEFRPVPEQGDNFEFILRGSRIDVEQFLDNFYQGDE